MKSGQETTERPRRHRVAIIGAGPGGLCMGIQLRHAGIEDFVIFEKSSGVGGTWFNNHYPGLSCDIKSHLYSFSFEIKPDWSRPYAAQPEIRAYFEHCASKYDLYRHIRLDTAVQGAHWDDECTVWRLVTEGGEELEFDIVVSGLGMFNLLNRPDILGLDQFAGTIFHSADWRDDHDLKGESVAVIGSAASAIQFVPEIAKRVGKLDLYQRTANWVLPKEDDPFSQKEIEESRANPALVRRMRQEHWDWVNGAMTFSDPEALESAREAGERAIDVVKDPQLRAKLTPTIPYGAKRGLFSNDYYPTFNRSNVELVNDGIAEIKENSIVTEDGEERRADTIILATGFQTTKFLSAIDVTGRGGVPLAEAWGGGAQAYLGITTSGFPNLFMLYGPNTNNGSLIYMIECQVAYALRQIQRMDDQGIAWMDVQPEVMQTYNDRIQRALDKIGPWQADRDGGYYRGETGTIVTQWPGSMSEYGDLTTRPDPEAYEVHYGRPLASR